MTGGVTRRETMRIRRQAGGMLHCRRDADLHPELIRLVRLAFADALHLGRMQRIDLAAALAAILRQHPLREMEQLDEGLAQFLLAHALAADVADDAAETIP